MNIEYAPEDIREIINIVDPYLPLVDEILEKAGPILDKIFSRLTQYERENTVKSIKYYESEGFSRADAILLTINSNVALQKVLENTSAKRK
jgi:hypothetical protein